MWNTKQQLLANFAAPPLPEIFELHDKTLGIIGLGRIGSELSKKAQPLFKKIIAIHTIFILLALQIGKLQFVFKFVWTQATFKLLLRSIRRREKRIRNLIKNYDEKTYTFFLNFDIEFCLSKVIFTRWLELVLLTKIEIDIWLV